MYVCMYIFVNNTYIFFASILILILLILILIPILILILILIHTNTSYRGREGRREGRGKGCEKNILGFWFRFVSKVLSNGGS